MKTLLLALLCAMSCSAADSLRRIGGFTGGGSIYDTPQIVTNNVALSRNRALMHKETLRRMKANPVNHLPLTQPKPKPTTNAPAIKPDK